MQHPRAVLLSAAILITTGWSASPCHGQHDAVTTARHDIDMSFDVAGRVLSISKKNGDYVSATDIVMVLEDKVGAAQVERLQFEAQNDVSVRAQEAQLEMAKVNRDILMGLEKTGAATGQELRRAKVEVKIAQLQLEQAQMDLKIKREIELKQAIDQHARYTLRAKIGGYIEKVAGREVAEGESVQAFQPVVRIVKTDELMVDAFVPTGETLLLKAGNKTWIRANQPEHDQPVEGTIKHIAKVADPASNTKRIRIHVPNEKEYLEAGWHVIVYFSRPKPLTGAQVGTSNDHPL